MPGAPEAVRGHYTRRFFRGIARAISNHRVVSHGLIPSAVTGAISTLKFIEVQHANVFRDAFSAETLMGLPPSIHLAIISTAKLGAIVLVGMELLTTALGIRRLRELDIPSSSPALGIDLRGPILQAIGMETDFLARPLAEKKISLNGLIDQIKNGWERLAVDEQNLATAFLDRLDQNINEEEAQAAAAVPPPLPGSPFAGIAGVSVPPPPPSFKLAPGADPTMLSSPPPRATVVPTAPGPAGPPVVMVPPPPPSAPPAKEPSAIIRAGRALARGAARLVGRGPNLPPPPAGAGQASAPLPPRRRFPITDPDFYAAFQAIQQAQEKGGDKTKALQTLEALKQTNKLSPQQLKDVEEYIAKINEYLQLEKDMKTTPDPALQARHKLYLIRLNEAAKLKGDEISVAILAGQGGISKDDATVFIQDVDQQIQQRWQELQILLAGESQDSIDQTKAVMAGELWESAPTVNVDQKLAGAFKAFIKRAKKADPFALDLITRYFNNGHFKTLLNRLKQESVIKKLGIVEDDRFEELLRLLRNYTAGSGGN
ncbi:hypothetical protein HZC35_03540 [Candidatus Saganbacteria bacterium]|nr:hypothetical protein [Candidatus Saganbacteria bacterium]